MPRHFDEFRAFLRRYWILALAFTIGGTIVTAIGIANLPYDVAQLSAPAAWLLTTPWGKGVLCLIGLLWIVWFWVIFPWLSRNSLRSHLDRLCYDMEAVAGKCGSEAIEAVNTAMVLGAIVLECRKLGAFRSDPHTEGLIDAAMRGDLVQQIGPTGTTGDPNTKREYQVLWVAADCAGKARGFGPLGIGSNPSPPRQHVQVAASLVAWWLRSAHGIGGTDRTKRATLQTIVRDGLAGAESIHIQIQTTGLIVFASTKFEALTWSKDIRSRLESVDQKWAERFGGEEAITSLGAQKTTEAAREALRVEVVRKIGVLKAIAASVG